MAGRDAANKVFQGSRFASLLTACLRIRRAALRKVRAATVGFLTASRAAGRPRAIDLRRLVALLDRTDDLEHDTKPATPVRRLVLLALMCLALGGLGGVFAATATKPDARPRRASSPRARRPTTSRCATRTASARASRTRAARSSRSRSSTPPAATSARPRGATSRPRCAMVGGGVEAYIISVDPIGDTPARVKRLAEPARVPRLLRSVPDRHPRRAAPGLDPLRHRAAAGDAGRGRSGRRRRRRLLPRQSRSTTSRRRGRSTTRRRRSRRPRPRARTTPTPTPPTSPTAAGRATSRAGTSSTPPT